MAENFSFALGELIRSVCLHREAIRNFGAHIPASDRLYEDLLTILSTAGIEEPKITVEESRVWAQKECAPELPPGLSLEFDLFANSWTTRWAGERYWFLADGRTAKAAVMEAIARGKPNG